MDNTRGVDDVGHAKQQPSGTRGTADAQSDSRLVAASGYRGYPCTPGLSWTQTLDPWLETAFLPFAYHLDMYLGLGNASGDLGHVTAATGAQIKTNSLAAPRHRPPPSSSSCTPQTAATPGEIKAIPHVQYHKRGGKHLISQGRKALGAYATSHTHRQYRASHSSIRVHPEIKHKKTPFLERAGAGVGVAEALVLRVVREQRLFNLVAAYPTSVLHAS
eukprot:1743932-Rhodomonas_salina.1